MKAYKPDAKTYNYLGESYLETGKAEESLEAFNSALGYNPDFDKARYNLGRAYVKLGNRDMAGFSTRYFGTLAPIGPTVSCSVKSLDHGCLRDSTTKALKKLSCIGLSKNSLK